MKQIKKGLSVAMVGLLFACAHAITVDETLGYFWANYQQFRGNAPEAHGWYKKLMENEPSVRAYKGYLIFLLASGAHAEIVELIPRLDETYQNDIEVQLVFAQALQKQGNVDASEARFIQMSNRFKTSQAVVFQAAQIYVKRKEPGNAIIVIDGLLDGSPRRPNNFIFHFLKAQIYVQLNEREKALAATTACLDMHAHFDKGWLLYALLHEQKGELDNAISGYTRFLEVSKSNDPTIRNRLLELTFKQKVAQKSSGTVEEHAYFEQALSTFDRKDYHGALKQINKCLEATPKDPEARLLKIQILSALNQYTQAGSVLKAWILQSPEDEVWYQSLYLLCKNGLAHQKAIGILEDIVKKHPRLLIGYLYLADLNSRVGNLQMALVHHEKALKIVKDPLLKTKILFNMGQIYYTQGKFDEVEKVLEQGYALNQQFSPLLNMLAYHYATQSKNLGRAQQLIDMALATSTNLHFLDTKALVLYKQGRYESALSILQEIKKHVPEDFSMLKHLAKTYHRLGNKQEAMATITQALQGAHSENEKNKANFIIAQWST